MHQSRPQAIRFRLCTCPLSAVMAVSVVLPPGCAVRTWRATPLAEEAVREKVEPNRRVRVETSTGPVLLEVVSLRYPILEGRARPGNGEVLFDVTRASSAVSVAGSTSDRLADGPEKMRQAVLVGKLVRFGTEAGPVTLDVTAFEYPLVRGRPGVCPSPRDEKAPCPGLVHLDLREASRLEIRETDEGKTLLVNLLVWGFLLGFGLHAYLIGP